MRAKGIEGRCCHPLGPEAWSLGPEAWSLGPEAWSLGPEVWSLIAGGLFGGTCLAIDGMMEGEFLELWPESSFEKCGWFASGFEFQ